MVEKILLLLEEKAKTDEQLREALEKMEENGKSGKGLHAYVVAQARKIIQVNSGMVDSDTVLGWAIHYVTESNDHLGVIAFSAKTNPIQEVEKTNVEVKKKKAETKKPKKEVKKSNVVQLDLFDALF